MILRQTALSDPDHFPDPVDQDGYTPRHGSTRLGLPVESDTQQFDLLSQEEHLLIRVGPYNSTRIGVCAGRPVPERACVGP